MRKRLCSLLLLFAVLISVLPQTAIAAEPADPFFLNSDVEAYSGEWCYRLADGEDSFAFREKSPEDPKERITDYAVSQLAVEDETLYVAYFCYLKAINTETTEETVLVSADADISRFAVLRDRILYLSGGNIFALDRETNAVSVLFDGLGIERFWMEDSDNLSYMINNENIVTVDLYSGKATEKKDNASVLGEVMVPRNDGKRGVNMTTLQNKFPPGQYWNHMPKTGTGSAYNNQDGCTSKPCPNENLEGRHYGYGHGYCGTSNQTCNGYAPNGEEVAWQCMGYAEKCGYDVTGFDPRTNADGWQTYTNSSALDNLKAGDIVRYRTSSYHSIYVIGVSGDTVRFTDCNSDGHCIIRWNATISKSTLKSKFYHLRSAPGSQTPAPTHTRDSGYPTNYTCYATGSSNITVYYEDYSAIPGRYISPGDRCTIHEVYTDGFCKVTYPTSSGSYTAYCWISNFGTAPSTFSKEEKVFQFCINEIGLNAAAACAVLANIEAESSFNTGAIGDHGSSYGICQWHDTRKTDLKTFCNSHGYDWTTLDGQLHFMYHEVSTKSMYSSTWKALQTADNSGRGAYDAAYQWCINFERPANATQTAKTRGALAQNKYWPIYQSYISACAHSYSSGHCTKCGALQPLQNSSLACRTGIYASNTTTYLHSDPYETGANNVDNKKVTIRRGEEVTVVGAVVNGIGNTWYKVSYGSQTGYIYAPRLDFRREATGWLTTSDFTVPTNHKKGSGFHISGTISAEGCTILEARALFVNASSLMDMEETATAWYTYNSNSLSLYNSKLDNNLRFGKLPEGSYYYCIQIKTDNLVHGHATSEFLSPIFTVGAASVPAPTISASGSGIGSKTYSISGTGTVQYRIDGGSWQNGTSVTVNNSCLLEARCVSGNLTSATSSAYVTLSRVTAPDIDSNMTPNGATVCIASDSGATIYYKIDAGSYQKYSGPFSVSSQCKVTAYAQRNGYLTSDEYSVNVTVSAPEAPKIFRDTDPDIPEGAAMTVHWTPVTLASSYAVTILKDGEAWRDDVVTAAQYTFQTAEDGVYSVSVTAVNAIGTSTASNSVSSTAHDPCTVTFVDYDGTNVSIQLIPYGTDASKPSAPRRRGYTFSGWNRSYSRVTEDITVTAEYEINTYTVKFYDINGTTLLSTQQIEFNMPIDSATPEQSVSIENGGRIFGGWLITKAADDSYRDLEHIDSDMKLQAVTIWAEQDLPVYVDNISASVCYDNNNGVFNGYTVSCNVSTEESADLKAKIVVTLLSEVDGEEGVMRTSGIKVDTINFTAGQSNKAWTGDVLCSGTENADFIEIVVLSVEGSDRTGGMLSEAIRVPIDAEATRYWSEWMTAEELAAAGHTINEDTVETKTQYRDRTNTKSTVTSSSSTPPAGYTLQSDNSYWGNWSGWSDSSVASSSTRQVETQQVKVSQGYTQYRYGSWYNGSKSHFCGGCISSPWLRYTDWSTTRYSKTHSDTWNYCSSYTHYTNGQHIGYLSYDGSKFYWSQWTVGGKQYYWEESRWVDTSYYKTQYRYRDYVGSYTYYKWDYGNWSDWTDTVLTDTDLQNPSYEVTTRNLYRYVIFDADDLPVNTQGVTRTVSGTLEHTDSDMNGKLATVFVYKSLNSDPTESQLEYIGQTALGENGNYSFTFRTKETPTEETGDFVVALAIEGGDGLINVGLIRYERPTYTVTFSTESGVVATQEVSAGGTAEAPEAPALEGYTFIGWSRSLSNITANTSVVAKYAPKDCCVVFVDYLNQQCIITHCDYGTVFTVPEEMAEPSFEGYDFTGWSSGEDATVTGDMVVSAQWEAKTFTVNFYGDDGTVVSSQEVAYGEAAVPPTNIELEDTREFLAWSDEYNWWNVTSDVNVFPIVAYRQTAEMPISSSFDYTSGLRQTLRLSSEENATIYYTFDGTEPDPEHLISADSLYGGEDGITYVYTNEIELTENAQILAKAVVPEKNDSEVSEFVFQYEETQPAEDGLGEQTDLATKNVILDAYDTATVAVNLAANPQLRNYSFYIKADPTVVCVDFDRETNKAAADAGLLCDGEAQVIVEEYVEGLGWKISWSGDAAETATDGSLLTVRLIADPDSEGEIVPITVGYLPEYTSDQTGDAILLEDIVSVIVSTAKHVHDYAEDRINATCTEAGSCNFLCKICGNAYTETYEATGHTWITEPDIEATCTQEGYHGGTYCSVCNTVLDPGEATGFGHAWDDGEQIAPTCSAVGYTKFTCMLCGETKMTDYTFQTHEWVHESGTPRMCLGYTGDVYCSHCGNIQSLGTWDMSGNPSHHYYAAETAATCTERGYTTYTCSVCGDHYVSNETPALGHLEETVAGAPPTCTASGMTDGVRCTVCGETVVEQQEILALGHDYYITEAKAPTCTEGGVTAGCVCTRCDSAPVSPLILPALGHTDANTDNRCDTCGIVLAFDIHSAALKLDEDINMVYAVDVPDSYTNPYMVLTYHDTEFTVDEYQVNSDGRYCFEFANINPQCMGDNISATVYASCEGKVYTDTVAEYSVRDYCVNLLSKTDDETLTTLLSDLLTYGAAAQVYMSYKTDNLVTEGLDLTPTSFAALKEKTVSFTGEQDATVYWTAASLVLTNDLAARLAFAADSTDGLTVEVSINDRMQNYTVLTSDGDGRYYITFDGIMATEFDDTVTAIFYRDGVQIGAAVNYSVNTYICSTQNSDNANLQALVRALYNYGASAKAYAEGTNE